MSIVNFDRDLSWLLPSTNFINFSAEAPWNVNTLTANTDGVVYEQECYLDYYTNNSVTFSAAGTSRYIGVHIIGSDITGGSPYRIKGYCKASAGSALLAILYGIGPATPSGTDTVLNSRPIFSNITYIEVNETVYIPSLDKLYPGQGYENRPLTFMIMIHSGSDLTIHFSARLSIQRLSVKPPAYITANR